MPEGSSSDAEARDGDFDRMAVGGGVVDPDPGNGAGVEDAGFDMAGAVGEGGVGRGRAGETELLDGDFALVPELQLDIVFFGLGGHQGDRAGPLTIEVRTGRKEGEYQGEDVASDTGVAFHATEDSTSPGV